ncbi:hypothetical protein FSPOR_5953 [Fusarium sporotrichioides]|uniref:Uncharacterized protein n=1 Tax=Fusarium sporotrichioides TaxID=5514 RepID=A0A395S5T5_FUSSP|nr:hypothetical protein FSPOR_5953 [Fusarium sporotrichioides]
MHPTAVLILFVFGMVSCIRGSSAQTTVFILDDGGNFNCPGVLQNDNGNDKKAYCCVGGELDLSTCQGWPICTGSSWKPKPITCATTVPVSATDYNAQIRSARSKYLEDEMPSATGDSVSSATTDKSGSQQAATTSATGAASGAASSAASSTSAATGNGASVMMPSLTGGLIGGLMMLWSAL